MRGLGAALPTDRRPALLPLVLPWPAASLVLRSPLRRVAGTALSSPAPPHADRALDALIVFSYLGSKSY